MARRHVDGQRHLAPGPKAGSLDRLHHVIERRFIGRQLRPEPAFVGDARQHEPVFAQDLLHRAMQFDDGFQRFRERIETVRNNQKVLEIDLTTGMQPARENIDHRYGQQRCPLAAQVFPQRNAARDRHSACHRQRCAENRIGSETLFVGRAIEFDQAAVELFLRLGGTSLQRLSRFRLATCPAALSQSVRRSFPKARRVIRRLRACRSKPLKVPMRSPQCRR